MRNFSKDEKFPYLNKKKTKATQIGFDDCSKQTINLKKTLMDVFFAVDLTVISVR